MIVLILLAFAGMLAGIFLLLNMTPISYFWVHSVTMR